MAGETLESTMHPLSTKRGPVTREKLQTLEQTRVQFSKLLRMRITEGERELERLRQELASLGGTPVARKVQTCSICGTGGHTKRTCLERGKKKAEKSE